MRQFSDGRRGVALFTGVGVAWLALYVIWVALEPFGEAFAHSVADTVYLAPIATAAAMAFIAARRAAAVRDFWMLLGVANLCWLVGAAFWTVRELALGEASVPFPWWTDAAYLAAYPLMLVAVLRAFKPSLRVLGVAPILDAALIVGILALLWWWVIVPPLGIEATLASAVAVTYATFDIVLIGLLVATWLLPARQGTIAMRLVAGGIFAGTLLNGIYMRAAHTGAYPNGEWMEIGWQAEAILFSLGALVTIRGLERDSSWRSFRHPARHAPEALVVAVFVALVVVLAVDGTSGGISVTLVAASGTLAALAVARLWLFLRPALEPLELRDARTGAYNAGYFEDQLRRLLGRGRHFGDSFGVVMIELDGGRGVARGELEAALAKRVLERGREVDVVCALESRRFAVLMPNVERAEVLAIGEALRADVGTEPLVPEAPTPAPTVSIGVAVWTPEDTAETLVARAETGLAAARRLGGNQVRCGADDSALFSDSPLDAERFDLIVSFAKMVDGREGPDPEHSRAVANLASEIALEMGLDAEAVSRTYLAGLLHDVGKLALPEAMLQKPGPLDEREWEEMTRHASVGAELVEKMGAVREAAPIVAAHHERWDGQGYPSRLQGDRIPPEARIVAVADALMAMTTDRPYRAARSETSALTTIWRESGKRYDPAVVSALLALARDGKLKLSEPDAATAALAGLRIAS